MKSCGVAIQMKPFDFWPSWELKGYTMHVICIKIVRDYDRLAFQRDEKISSLQSSSGENILSPDNQTLFYHLRKIPNGI